MCDNDPAQRMAGRKLGEVMDGNEVCLLQCLALADDRSSVAKRIAEQGGTLTFGDQVFTWEERGAGRDVCRRVCDRGLGRQHAPGVQAGHDRVDHHGALRVHGVRALVPMLCGDEGADALAIMG